MGPADDEVRKNMQVWRSILVCLGSTIPPTNLHQLTDPPVSRLLPSPLPQYADQTQLMRTRRAELMEDNGIDFEFAQEQRACKLIQNYWLGRPSQISPAKRQAPNRRVAEMS